MLSPKKIQELKLHLTTDHVIKRVHDSLQSKIKKISKLSEFVI